MRPARWIARCPAKVNLVLRVSGRRRDGYHELRTVLQTLDWWDVLEAEHANGLQLTCDEPGVPTDDSNLVLRAAEALRRDAGAGGRTLGAVLHLRKQIPPGAGLGGGSSDAVGALVVLRRLWGLPVSFARLHQLATGLGSDVPFFLHGGTALGLGRGERIEVLPFVGPLRLLVGTPPFGISTAEVYSLTLQKLGVSVTPLSAVKPPFGNDFGAFGNDLEAVVFERWTELKAFRDALQASGARRAVLCGSGSSVFGVYEDPVRLSSAMGWIQAGFPTWKLRATRAIRRAVQLEEGGTSA